MKLRVTLTYEYETNPEYYDTGDPAKMAAVDRENLAHPGTLLEALADDLTENSFDVKVEVV